MRWFVTALVTLLCGCKGPAPAAPSTEPAALAASPAASPSTTKVDPRTPAQFAEAWITVLKNLEPGSREGALAALVKGWQGRRLRWTGLALASLCVEAKHTCGLMVWPYDLPGRKALGGTLPLVTFAPAEWAKFAGDCKGKDRCVVTFEATLVELTADFEKALRFEFKDGAVVALRDPSPADKWSRPRVAPPAQPDPKLKTGAGTSVKLDSLVRKTF